MRLGARLLLCLSITGCALWRKDREEPVENGPRKEKAEPVLKPSEVLKPESLEIASPVTDHFYMRATTTSRASRPSCASTRRTALREGTLLSAEEDLGLDDEINQGRIEFDIRLGERNHMRVDYFKLSRFQRDSRCPRTSISAISRSPRARSSARRSTGACFAMHVHLFVLQWRTLRGGRGSRHAHHPGESVRAVSPAPRIASRSRKSASSRPSP